DEGRVGTFCIERGAKPRPTKTIYDRAGSAFATLTADELNWDAIGQAEWLYFTGITPALSETCRRNAPEILKRTRALRQDLPRPQLPLEALVTGRSPRSVA
ncbi:MAG: hypothetical protein MUQ10_19665, partial [Anaerolineae bacterium]|nr:hypothetical protein [Anaerolineae bacterium]